MRMIFHDVGRQTDIGFAVRNREAHFIDSFLAQIQIPGCSVYP